MNLKCTHLCCIMLIALVAVTGCQRSQRMIIDDPVMDDTEAKPAKLIWLIDYPENGKAAYIEWIASIVETLQAPEEVVRIKSYDNQEAGMRPHRLVEYYFESFLDAATYLNRPEIAAINADFPNHANQATTYTFIQDTDYTHAKAEGDWQIKHIYLINYALGGKQAYLSYATDISAVLVPPTQLKAIASYDNYYGVSPHRLVELEFATEEDADAYHTLEEVRQTAEAEPEIRAGNWSQVLHKFKLRSDYINK